MQAGGILIVIIVAIFVIVAISAIVYLKIDNKDIGEKMSRRIKKNSKANNVPQYTKKDRDMMRLIHELSIVYEKTDNYLNNK